MVISVQNITANTAVVIWPSMSSCSDSFYSIMYQSNWNTMLSGYSKEKFKEERIPTSRTLHTVENLAPLTTYILCVTCQSANPSSDQCKVFNTLGPDPATVNSKKKDLALGIWLTSSIILLIIACILIYGCLHIWWRKRQERASAQNAESNDRNKRQAWTKNEEPVEEYEKPGLLAVAEEDKREDVCADNTQQDTQKDPLTGDETNSLNCTHPEQKVVQLTAVN
ncbi:PREDICTED: fibronectin type III domain-containing protein 9 [Nanorana parkeri]|uniref:fibronectin type III domain-containing protein 9 n=1 Tax=Nanorana parkeri TaxID=125878 RepID=UPI000855051F|nr:PREDICTED: fibronectin type III domain-containing protein 9 [Nanorana parkeri]